MPFTCSICGEESTRICARCTKDACNNHICEKCSRCSDCCECELALSEPVHEPARSVLRAVAAMRSDENESTAEDEFEDEPPVEEQSSVEDESSVDSRQTSVEEPPAEPLGEPPAEGPTDV